MLTPRIAFGIEALRADVLLAVLFDDGGEAPVGYAAPDAVGYTEPEAPLGYTPVAADAEPDAEYGYGVALLETDKVGYVVGAAADVDVVELAADREGVDVAWGLPYGGPPWP